MRLFLAIDLPERVRSELGAMVTLFRKHGADVKWSEPQHLHLTLRFLGEVDEEVLGRLSKSLASLAGATQPFQLRLATLGGFPDLQRPKILWVGAEQGKDDVQRLAGAVETAVQGLGFKPEPHPFSPHVTLGRVRGPRNLQSLIGEIKWMPFTSGYRFEVDHLALYKSTLRTDHPIHEVIQAFALKK